MHEPCARGCRPWLQASAGAARRRVLAQERSEERRREGIALPRIAAASLTAFSLRSARPSGKLEAAGES